MALTLTPGLADAFFPTGGPPAGDTSALQLGQQFAPQAPMLTNPLGTPEERMRRAIEARAQMEQIGMGQARERALLQLGLSLMQPTPRGQTVAGRVGTDVAGAVGMYDKTKAQEEAAVQREREVQTKEAQAGAEINKASADTQRVLGQEKRDTELHKPRLKLADLENKVKEAEVKKLEYDNAVNAATDPKEIAWAKQMASLQDINTKIAQAEYYYAHSEEARAKGRAAEAEKKQPKPIVTRIDDTTALITLVDEKGQLVKTYQAKVSAGDLMGLNIAARAAGAKTQAEVDKFVAHQLSQVGVRELPIGGSSAMPSGGQTPPSPQSAPGKGVRTVTQAELEAKLRPQPQNVNEPQKVGPGGAAMHTPSVFTPNPRAGAGVPSADELMRQRLGEALKQHGY